MKAHKDNEKIPYFLLCVLQVYVMFFLELHSHLIFIQAIPEKYVTHMTGNNKNKTLTLYIVKTFLSTQWTQFNTVHSQNQSAYGMTQV